MFRNRVWFAWGLCTIAGAMLLSGCGGASRPDAFSEKDSKAENWSETMAPKQGKEAESYRAILKLYSDREFEQALGQLQRYEKRYPKSAYLSQIHNLQGLIQLQRKRPLPATQQFKLAIEQTQNPKFIQFLRYNLAVAQYEAKLTDNALESLRLIESDDLDLSTRLKFLYLWARLDQRLGVPHDSVDKIMKASYILRAFGDEYSTLNDTRKLLEAHLETSVNEVTDFAKLEQSYREHPDSPLTDALLFFTGRKAYKVGFAGVADAMVRMLTQRFPQSPYYAEGMDIMRTIQSQTKVDSRKVGVLLPLSGRFGKFAEHSLDAIELAFGMYGDQAPNPAVEIVVEDTGPQGEFSVRALEKLYFDHNVVDVIGPMLSKNIQEVTQRAQELGLPMLSLAPKTGVSGNFAFQLAVSAANQAQEIARYAVEKEGLKRFVIAYPSDPFGREYSDAFWNAVEEAGGKVVGVENYDPKETDFRSTVDKLTGLHYQDARSLELKFLQDLRDQFSITKRYWKTEPFFRLKPIIDFDAVFIPDSAKNVSQMLPTFAYRDVEGVRYLGIPTWNSPRIVRRSDNYANGAVFVDVFNPRVTAREVQDFVERFSDTFGFRPTSIEALAFDAGSLLRRVLSVAGTEISRTEVRDMLQAVRSFPGATGKITYQDGSYMRNLKLFKIEGSKVAEVN
ncbi:MAG: penicillin-binding protein activator [Bdellovibrionales bacterium]|nr:penicillin-binding protein activator [Bdellovibrionales bacterium]